LADPSSTVAQQYHQSDLDSFSEFNKKSSKFAKIFVMKIILTVYFVVHKNYFKYLWKTSYKIVWCKNYFKFSNACPMTSETDKSEQSSKVVVE